MIDFAADVERKESQFRFLGENQQFARLACASAAVGRDQLQSGRAGARVTRTIGQTKMGAAAAITAAPIHVFRLSQWVDAVNVHGEMQIGPHRSTRSK
jgi:hypothetical protein